MRHPPRLVRFFPPPLTTESPTTLPSALCWQASNRLIRSARLLTNSAPLDGDITGGGADGKVSGATCSSAQPVRFKRGVPCVGPYGTRRLQGLASIERRHHSGDGGEELE